MYLKKILYSVYSSLLQHCWQLQLLGDLIHRLHLQKFFTFLRTKKGGGVGWCMSDDNENAVLQVTDQGNSRRLMTCNRYRTGSTES